MHARTVWAPFQWGAVFTLCVALLAGCQQAPGAGVSPLPTSLRSPALAEPEQTGTAAGTGETALPAPGTATALPAMAPVARPSRAAPPAGGPPGPLSRATRAGCQRIPLGPALTREEVVEEARRHLAAWLGVEIEAIQVLAVEEIVEGPPADLPPPPAKVPDRAYLPRLAGYRILLEVDGVVYEYRQVGRWLVFGGAVDGQGQDGEKRMDRRGATRQARWPLA